MLAKVSSARLLLCHLGALLWDACHVQLCVFLSLYISYVCCELVAHEGRDHVYTIRQSIGRHTVGPQ